MQSEDPPVKYGEFDVAIPQGECGGGTANLGNRGTWVPVGDPYNRPNAFSWHFCFLIEARFRRALIFSAAEKAIFATVL